MIDRVPVMQGGDRRAGMPRMMALLLQELVVTPETTCILTDGSDYSRCIFTEGREWPATIQPNLSELFDRQMDRERRRPL